MPTVYTLTGKPNSTHDSADGEEDGEFLNVTINIVFQSYAGISSFATHSFSSLAIKVLFICQESINLCINSCVKLWPDVPE